MNGSRGVFTLYYSTRPQFSTDETGQEAHFDNLSDAVLRATLISQEGGNPTHLVYDDAVLFSGDDLIDLLKRISDCGGQSDAVLNIARSMEMADTHALRGYDAVQLGAALEVNRRRVSLGATPLVLVTGDTQLIIAAAAEGLLTDDPNAH